TVLFPFFFQAEDGIRCRTVTGVQTCALPIYSGVIRKSKPVSGLQNLTFGLTGVGVNVATAGTLSSLQIERRDTNHPNATAGIQKIGRASCRERGEGLVGEGEGEENRGE